MVQIIRNIFSSSAFALAASSRHINALLSATIEYFFPLTRESRKF